MDSLISWVVIRSLSLSLSLSTGSFLAIKNALTYTEHLQVYINHHCSRSCSLFYISGCPLSLQFCFGDPSLIAASRWISGFGGPKYRFDWTDINRWIGRGLEGLDSIPAEVNHASYDF